MTWWLVLMLTHPGEAEAILAHRMPSLTHCHVMAQNQNRIRNTKAICVTSEALQYLGRQAGN